MKAYFTDDFGPAQEIKTTEWDSETKQMQKFVKNNLDAIFSNHPNPKDIVMLAKELVIGSNRIDFIFIDSDGDFYIVETKREKNTDGKRKIFAQIDDYACSVWSELKLDQNIDGFFSLCEKNLQAELNDYSLTLNNYLQQQLTLDDSPEKIKEDIKKNIVNHNITFVIVMDKLDDDIKRQIIYRVDQKIKTYGVELQKYHINDKILIIPSTFSLESTASGKKSKSNWERPKNDDDRKFIWDTYEKYVKVNSDLDSNLRLAILELTSKFNEWDAIPLLHPSDMALGINSKKVRDGTHQLIKIQPDGSISLRTEPFRDNSKIYEEFRNDISNIDQSIKDKISSGRQKIRISPKIWIPKIEMILNIFEKHCK